jgi:hypothetical protein
MVTCLKCMAETIDAGGRLLLTYPGVERIGA